MDARPAGGVLSFFQDIPDPRAANVRFRLADMMTMAIMAVVSGADDWSMVAAWAAAKAKWLRTFMDLPDGATPSCHTFRRLFERLNPEAFEACFLKWMQEVVKVSGGKLVAVDGKTLRRSFQHGWDKSGMAHMVSAFVQANSQVLSQIQCEGKGQEISAILQLLALVDIQGAVVSIDAIGCQKTIARTIVEAKADYVLAVKENQRSLFEALEREFNAMVLDGFKGKGQDQYHSVEEGHGRREVRRTYVTNDISWLRVGKQWMGLNSVAMVETTREVLGTEKREVQIFRRFYISSLSDGNAARMSGCIRGHWGVENNLHWQLDVSFQEDQSRLRKGHGAQNMSRLRRIALNLLKNNKMTRGKARKGGIKTRRGLAGWDHDFLLEVLTGTPAT
jgi:predicted transposase YbfD/YdcC